VERCGFGTLFKKDAAGLTVWAGGFKVVSELRESQETKLTSVTNILANEQKKSKINATEKQPLAAFLCGNE